jgi:hypothetical protein
MLLFTGSQVAFSQSPQVHQSALTVLPPGLISFMAKQVNDKIWLTWSNNKEEQLSHYIIERSYDNNSFDQAGIIFTGEKQEATTDYSFQDDIRNSAMPVIYYRLKMVNKDGTSKYSRVKIVRPEKASSFNLVVTGNKPASALN